MGVPFFRVRLYPFSGHLLSEGGFRHDLADERTTPASPFLGAELPPSVTATLEAQGARPDRMNLAVRSDLAPDGQFGEQWLLIDQRDLWVMDRHNGTAPALSLPLDKIEDAKVERCVGNGLMQVTVERTAPGAPALFQRAD